MPYIGNKQNMAQITNVHYWDSAANAWSGNLIGAATPFQLLPNPVLIDDLIVFGIDNTVVNSGPFCSLVFDIAVLNTATITWKHSDVGGVDPTAWTGFIAGAIPFQDNTNQDGVMGGTAFDTAGIASVHWEQPALWVAQDPQVGAGAALGVTGFWVCADVTGGAGGGPPTQDNRDIYTITWPSVEVDGDDIGGDIPAPLRLLLRNESSASAIALDQANRIIAGIRRTDRGADFVSHINICNIQNPPLITVTGGALTADPQTPTGVKTVVIPLPVWSEQTHVRIATGLAEQYRGLFHAFMRIDQTAGAATDIQARLDIALYTGGFGLHENLVFSSRIARPRSIGRWEVLDFGRVQLAPDDILDGDSFNIEIRVMMIRFNPSTVDLFDFIVIPVDEWAGEFNMVPTGRTPWGERSTAVIKGTIVDMDSITVPKRVMNSVLRADVTGDFLYRPRFIGRAPVALTPDEDQRAYFLIINDTPDPGGSVQSLFELAGSATAQQVQRYLSMRGDR